MKRATLIVALVAAAQLVVHPGSETQAAGKWPIAPKKKSAKSSEKGADKKADAKKPFGDEKAFAEVVKDLEVTKGLFTFYRKVDENRIYMEILTNQFGETFLFSGSVDQAVGEKGLYASQMGGHFPFQFRMIGKTVQLVRLNPTFTAARNSPAERATERSFANSIVGSARIMSQPHPERKSFLVNLSDLLLTDIPGMAAALKETYKPSDYRFDKGNSAIAEIKAFPDNVLLEAWLHFTSDQPKTRSVALADERSIPMTVKYDISRLPSSSYRPRYADDRVGHFLTLQQDFTSDKPSSPYVRRIHRWNLVKKDPLAEVSEPEKPIVFWIENTVPLEYREWMTEGVLLWNKAFERIGFTNAVVVKVQPDDADWDPADTRYSTIRWFAGVDASFAIGPSRANPYTGEIYDADIGFSEGIIRSIRRNGEEFIAPVFPGGEASAGVPVLAWGGEDGHLCQLSNGLAQQAALGLNVLEARGGFTPEMEERMMREYVVQVTAHEVGHTLGLRHNFRASTMLKPEELLDVEKTGEQGQSASVMDYNPVVVAGKGETQGHFLPVTLGPYDYWAIEYAYKPLLSREDVELAKIASRSSEPLLGYSSDEDALGTYSASAVDPLVNQFDQSSDPLRYFGQRIAIIKELWEVMDTKLVRPGEGYQILRRSLMRSLHEYNRGLLIASKFVGGLYHRRDHAGNGGTPFEPVPAEKQREALAFIERHAFSEEAFELSPELYNKLASERLPGLAGLGGLFGASRIDYAWHESVLNLQEAVLQRLHHPITLARIQDNQLRFGEGQERFVMADLFAGLEKAIWSELDEPGREIKSLRRNLQREHLKGLTRLALRTNSSTPEDATSLARATLARIGVKAGKAVRAGVIEDATTVAHLEETQARVQAALEAHLTKGLN